MQIVTMRFAWLASKPHSQSSHFSRAQNNDIERTPISFNASILSTPRLSSCIVLASPILKSSARLNLMERMEKSEKEWVWKGWFVKLVVGLSLIFMVEFGLSSGDCGILRPVLSDLMAFGF